VLIIPITFTVIDRFFQSVAMSSTSIAGTDAMLRRLAAVLIEIARTSGRRAGVTPDADVAAAVDVAASAKPGAPAARAPRSRPAARTQQRVATQTISPAPHDDVV
jgi:hypothetical protein